MKCGARTYSKIKSGKKKVFAVIPPSNWDDKELEEFELRLPKDVDRNYEICDGEIKIRVSAVNTPYMGGTDAELEISYSCSKCECSYWKVLPFTEYDLNIFLQNIIDGME